MVKNFDIVVGVVVLKDYRFYVVGFVVEINNVEEYVR